MKSFFHQTTPPGPLRHGLKPFSIWIIIRRGNRLCNRRFMSQRSHWLRCDFARLWLPLMRICMYANFVKNFSWVIESTVTCTAESLTALCKYDTAVTFNIIFSRIWLPLKGISIEQKYIAQLSYTIPITFTHKKWGLTRDRSLSQRSHWLRSDKNRRLQSHFSRRILIHIEKGFTPCIRDLGGVVWWKNPEVENLVSGPL
jgi:hypothetical protein